MTSLIKVFIINLLVTSKNKQFTNLKCCKKAREPFKTLFNGVLFLIYYFKKHFQPCFFILKALIDILQHFKFVNWWFRFFDVTNRLEVGKQKRTFFFFVFVYELILLVNTSTIFPITPLT